MKRSCQEHSTPQAESEWSYKPDILQTSKDGALSSDPIRNRELKQVWGKIPDVQVGRLGVIMRGKASQKRGG